MSWVLWIFVLPVSALITVGGLRAAGVPRPTAVGAGLTAVVVSCVALAAVWVTILGECLGGGGDPPPRHLCHDGSSTELGALAVTLVPPVFFVMLGSFLCWKQRRTLGWAVYALLLATPVLPSLYVNALA